MPPAMPPTITLTCIAKLVTAADAGNLQRFNLSNGQAMTGWILEINDSHVLIYSENPKQKAQQLSLAIAEIDPDTIAYFDPHSQSWRLVE